MLFKDLKILLIPAIVIITGSLLLNQLVRGKSGCNVCKVNDYG
jgi:hypothetical protein